ncbi:B-cell receptor CD22-like isoform X1 [Myxocyprinus asiaticus]|uniref:B-cell receptor CD22-like isoform X1 n=1 Tax=Myxocyprinus asiaticus TaxID=70543 RepID=UPI0022218FDC|nr:B-cell receptor CD22-like isoform X1 [Myxocyprinus asiaticus]
MVKGVAMVMSVSMAPPLPLIFLLMMQGVYSVDWGVSYSSSNIRALKGSSVIMSCTYKYPPGYKIEKVFWTKTDVKEQDKEFPDLFIDSEYSQRIQYLGDKQQNCTIRLNDVTQKDSHMYYFRFITDKPDGKWLGKPGVTLKITGVYSAGDWVVNYSSSNICALKGSSVIMSCTYKYPPEYQNLKVFWTKWKQMDVEPSDLSDDSEYSERIQYVGDKQQNCTLRLNDVTQKDSHEYYFRFITDEPDGRWIGKPGVTLHITDLHVESPESVTEGDTVSLTCKSTCNLTDRATFIWLKNTQSLTERNNKLLLQSVRREDAGRYSCAVHGHKLTSPHVYLNVTYTPKETFVVVSPSGEIVLGDSVNLTCSSDSNQPVLNYTWFKENTTVGSGKIYSITSIRSDHSGEYKCKSRNEVGEKYSDAVTLNVMYSPRNVSVSMSGSGEIVSGDSVNLTCSSDSNPPVLNYTWFKENTTVGSGKIYSITSIRSDHSGEYKCKSRNEVGEKYSDAVTLNVMYLPRNVSVSMSGSGEIVLGDSVTLTCSSDSNPPVLNYTWFKQNESSAVGSGQSYSVLQSGFFYCVAQNQHGSQRSAAVSVTVKGGHKTALYTTLATVAGCGFLIIIFTILYMRKRKRDHGTSDIRQKQVPPLTSDRTRHDDQYENVTPKRLRGKDIVQIQYATVQHHRHKENETQYDNIRTYEPGAAMRSAVQVTGDKSVVYSTVK